MGRTVQQIIEQLATCVTVVEPSDMAGLAEMHEHFIQVARSFNAGLDQQTQVQTASNRAQKLLEQIILQEVQDAQAALNEIGQLVVDVQKCVNSVPAVESVPAEPVAKSAPPVASAAAEAPTVHAAIESDTTPQGDDVPLARDFIAEATSHIESAEGALLVIEEKPGDTQALSSIFRSFHTIKGVAGFLNLKQIGSLAHASENVLDLARHGQLEISGPTADVILEAVDLMKALLAALTTALDNNTPQPINVRLPQLIARLDAAAKKQPIQPSAPASANTETPEPVSTSEQKSATGAKTAADATVKVSTDRLDALINMVGELVIAQSMVSQDMAASALANQKLSRNLAHVGKITRELQDLSMSMRMIPIQGVFQKMNRIVRDLAKKAGKEIEFVTVGGETELDRNLVEAISDPLVHMVRNSADHGVETPDIRLKNGKKPVGRIELRAFHQGGSIAIQIRDDGKGLPKARILQKAIDAGIVKPGQEMSEQDIFKLIFHPGLSTAEKVTDVSGRGVGMDVVKKNVEALRGRIDITSVEGQGATFTICLPLTLAVIDGLVVKVGTQRYIVPITSVEQTIQLKSDQLSTVQNRGELCVIRGKTLPLYRLSQIFSVQPRTQEVTESLVLILQDNQRRCCLVVDELVGQQQVVIKNLGESLGTIKGVSGAAILGDGSACLILDVPGVMDLASHG